MRKRSKKLSEWLTNLFPVSIQPGTRLSRMSWGKGVTLLSSLSWKVSSAMPYSKKVLLCPTLKIVLLCPSLKPVLFCPNMKTSCYVLLWNSFAMPYFENQSAIPYSENQVCHALIWKRLFHYLILKMVQLYPTVLKTSYALSLHWKQF